MDGRFGEFGALVVRLVVVDHIHACVAVPILLHPGAVPNAKALVPSLNRAILIDVQVIEAPVRYHNRAFSLTWPVDL